MNLLLWLNVLLDFIYLGFTELWAVRGFFPVFLYLQTNLTRSLRNHKEASYVHPPWGPGG